MKNREDLVPIVVGLFGLICLAVVSGCTWGVIKDGDGNIIGVGPNMVAVSESPPTAWDIAAETLAQPEVATAASASGLGAFYLIARAVSRSSSRKAREIEQRIKDAEYKAWDEAKLEQLRLQNTTGVNS